MYYTQMIDNFRSLMSEELSTWAHIETSKQEDDEEEEGCRRREGSVMSDEGLEERKSPN